MSDENLNLNENLLGEDEGGRGGRGGGGWIYRTYVRIKGGGGGVKPKRTSASKGGEGGLILAIFVRTYYVDDSIS